MSDRAGGDQIGADRAPAAPVAGAGAGGSEAAVASGLAASRASGRSLVAGLVGLLVCGALLLLVVHSIGPDRLREAVEATGPLAPIAYILLKAATVVVTPLSGTPLRLAAGTLFGFWGGVLYSVAGSVLGGSANFWIARLFGRAVVARLLGPATLARVEPILDRLGSWRTLVLVRVVLAPVWDALCYGIGLTRLRYRTFVIIAALGDVIPTIVLVGAGTSILETAAPGSGLTAGAPLGPGSVEASWWMAALIALTSALFVVTLLLRRRLARALAGSSPSAAAPQAERAEMGGPRLAHSGPGRDAHAADERSQPAA